MLPELIIFYEVTITHTIRHNVLGWFHCVQVSLELT